MELPAALQSLGFSEYEARAYVALVGREALNGYELAKASKVPRPNIYGVISKLLDKGAVRRLDRPGGVAYAAVDPRELIDRLQEQYAKLADSVAASLAALAVPGDRAFVWNVEGYTNVVDHAKAAVAGAKSALLFALWPNEAAALSEPMARAEQSGVEITTLCLAGCATECGGCRGKLYRYRTPANEASRSLIALADNQEVVAAQIDAGDAIAVQTRQRPIVELASSAIRNAIALAAVVRDLGPRLGELLTPETGALLGNLGPGATDMIFPSPS